VCDGFFQDRVSWTICPGWLHTVVLLISAFWVARTTGISHQHSAEPSSILSYLIWYIVHSTFYHLFL
jgi:TRAP-type C4-dicarboxylate transport system permease large subunit